MCIEKNQPKREVKITKFGIAMEVVSITFLLTNITYVIIAYFKLPDLIPLHFNLDGEAVTFGSKKFIFIFPGISLFEYILLTALCQCPHKFNYIVKITEDNADTQYNLAQNFLRFLKCLAIILFFGTAIFLVKLAEKTVKIHTVLLFGLGFAIIFVVSLISYCWVSKKYASEVRRRSSARTSQNRLLEMSANNAN